MAYVAAWCDIAFVCESTKADAIAKGQERYAVEIQAIDCAEEFVRLGEQRLVAEFAPIFGEVRAFYTSRISDPTATTTSPHGPPQGAPASP
jgi:hypothetical protein